MCKNRIEKSLNIEGIKNAKWNAETKIIEISYDVAKISEENIHQLIAEAGHDTEKAKTREDVYNKLPGCCKYERAIGQDSDNPKKKKRHTGCEH